MVLAVSITAPALALPGAVFEDDSLSGRDRNALQQLAQRVQIWAIVQRVVQAVQEQNDEPEALERVREIDAPWRQGDRPSRLVNRLASNDCASALQALLGANAGFTDVYVSDRRGVLVCMTGQAPAYFFGDDPHWSRVLAAGGEGTMVIGRQILDEELGVDVIHISVPVLLRGEAIGVLTVHRLAAAPE